MCVILPRRARRQARRTRQRRVDGPRPAERVLEVVDAALEEVERTREDGEENSFELRAPQQKRGQDDRRYGLKRKVEDPRKSRREARRARHARRCDPTVRSGKVLAELRRLDGRRRLELRDHGDEGAEGALAVVLRRSKPGLAELQRVRPQRQRRRDVASRSAVRSPRGRRVRQDHADSGEE